MYPLIHGIEKIGVRDPLIGLVVFQSVLNLIGVILFVPFLDRFSDFLEKRFSADNDSATFFIRDAGKGTSADALAAMEKEVLYFVHRVLPLNLDAFHSTGEIIHHDKEMQQKLNERNEKLKSYEAKYEDLKQIEGELLAFYLQQKKQENEPDKERFERLIAAVRNAIYSAKSMKDVRHNRKEFRDSANDAKYANYKFFQEHVEAFYKEIDEVFAVKEEQSRFEQLAHLLENAGKDYASRIAHIYKEAEAGKLSESDISSLLNTNREIYASSKAIIFSLKDLLLGEEYAGRFEDFPVLVER
jgi:phosphate:Na+ symporter